MYLVSTVTFLMSLKPYVTLSLFHTHMHTITLHHSYLVSFLLDSTVGLLIIFALLKAVAWLVSRYNFTPLVSGEYGEL